MFFRSIYKLPDLEIGFTSFNDAENYVLGSIVSNPRLKKVYLLTDQAEEECFDALCVRSLVKVVEQKTYFAISDIAASLKNDPDNVMARRFLDQGIKSVILAPVIKNNHLLGIIELVSENPGELNSINANQLENVMPYITDTIDRAVQLYAKNQIQAVIQNEYTTIHPSVYWKFRKEAVKFY